MPNRIWYFKSVPHQVEPTAVAHVWQWETQLPDDTVIVSSEVFQTLIGCVRDAQRKGFTGDYDPLTLSFTARGYRMKAGVHGSVTFIPLP